MNVLVISEDTATKARNHIPNTTHYPPIPLEPSHTADALAGSHTELTQGIHRTVRALADHLESVADFADTACRLDAELAGRLDHA